MNDPEQSVPWQQNGIRDLLAAYDDSSDFDEMPSATDASAGLVSLGYIGWSLRRSMPVWIVWALVGLFVGAGLALDHVPAYTATTTVLLATSAQNADNELPTDAAIAQSTPVAAAVVAQLGIQQTPVSFLQTYSVVAGTTTEILTITAKGPNSNAAMQRASAIATQFLAFRAQYLQEQLKQTIDSLDEQVTQAQQHLNSIVKQVSQVSAEPSSPSQQAQLAALKEQQTVSAGTLSEVKLNASSSQLTAQTTTDQMIRGSEVLSAATPGVRSVKKALAEYAGGGLVGGLAIGMAIVVIGAITTDRLRRRDDIAIAVGAPVKLSVGRLRGRWWLPTLREISHRRSRAVDLVVEHLRTTVERLRSTLPPDSESPVGLAIVAVDDAPAVAEAVVKLAISSSQQRKRVVLADLSSGAPAARQLGVTGTGVEAVSPEGVPIVVAVPEVENVAPVGALKKPLLGSVQVDELLAEATSRAHLVVSLVSLDPAFGADYLTTWATDAVVVVTAGKSTATRLHATGEMIRLAGIRLDSVVVLDADKSDESLGTVTADYVPASALGT